MNGCWYHVSQLFRIPHPNSNPSLDAQALPMPPAWSLPLSLTPWIPESPWFFSCLNTPSSFLPQTQLSAVPSVQKAFLLTRHTAYPWVSVHTLASHYPLQHQSPTRLYFTPLFGFPFYPICYNLQSFLKTCCFLIFLPPSLEHPSSSTRRANSRGSAITC